jgi:starch synthase
MDILMVTAELAPYVRATETGDAVAALSRSLAQSGHQVTIALPKMAGLEDSGLMMARRLSPLEIEGGDPVTVFDGQLPSGVKLVLFESKAVEPRAQAYAEEGKDYPDNIARFAMLCRATRALFQQKVGQGGGYEVVHAHDWPGALVSLLPGVAPPTVLTVHDPNRSATLTWKDAEALGLSLDADAKERLRVGSRASLLKGGMLTANVVATVSPTTAQELKDPEYFGPLASALAEAEVEIHGVLGGVDTAIYNPAVDTALPTRFDAEAPELKGSCKTALCKELELELEPERPLVVYAGVVDKESGADLVAACLGELLDDDVQLVVVGSGTSKALLRQFGASKLKKLPNYRFIDSDSGGDRRRVLAAADIALCPSRQHLTGHSVRVAQRYGAVPVAANVFGNRDAVVDCDAQLKTGNGFLFEGDDPAGLLGATRRAVAASRTSAWGNLRRRVLRLDVSWDRAARRYAQLYRIARKS